MITLGTPEDLRQPEEPQRWFLVILVSQHVEDASLVSFSHHWVAARDPEEAEVLVLSNDSLPIPAHHQWVNSYVLGPDDVRPPM